MHNPTPMPAVKRPRLPFLDWTRGLAAIVMLQGHTFHAFARNDLRNDGPYVYSQFIGGLPPAIFLFLTGVTFSFSMERGDRGNRSGLWRWVQALKRSRYLFLIAFLFRIQLWAFSYGHSRVSDLFKMDILNCMGATMLLLSPLAVLDREARVRAAALAGAGFAFLSPLVSMADWNWLPWAVRIYIVPSFDFFALFPWAAFLAFGLAAGTILKSLTADHMHRVMLWTTVVGFITLFTAQYFSNLPYNLYPASDFWLNSPLLILMKLGIVMIFTGLAFLWTEYVVHEKWSWVKQMGTTSLIVYWVHIELVYGRWFSGWKEQLNNYQCAAFALVLTGAMLLLSLARTHWRSLVPHWVPLPAPKLGRVPGD